jgi:hydrogenase nickel incorporation protein HypA/HybF
MKRGSSEIGSIGSSRRQATPARNGCGVEVWLGALSQFSAGHFRAHFDDEARGTAAQGAALHLVVSEDIGHPRAQSVVIQSVDLEIPDRPEPS